MPDAAGGFPIPNLGLSFADATSQAGNIASPVTFASIVFGRGTAGATNTSANPSSANDQDPTAVTPVTTLGGSGGGGGSPFDLLGSVSPFIENSMGLNGGMIQDPIAKLALYDRLPAGVKTTQLDQKSLEAVDGASPLPGPIAIGGLLLIAAVGAYFVFWR